MSRIVPYHSTLSRGATRLLVAVVILIGPPPSLFSQTTADITGQPPPDSLRTAAGISMGIGALVEGISINIHTPIPYFGAGHFIQGEWLSGAAYLGSELGMVILENALRDRVSPGDAGRFPPVSNSTLSLKTEGLGPASHAFQQYAEVAHQTQFYVRLLDFYDAYRGFHARTSILNKVQLSDQSVPGLMLSPFKPRYLTNPWVFGPLLLAGVSSYIDSRSDKSLSSAGEITMLNARFTPTGAAVGHGVIDAYRYMLVASGEEMFFRGAIQTELTERTEPAVAVGVSSLLFGAWHIPNNGIGGALAATLGGLYLGYRYEESGYDLGEVIATHFWLDFVTSVVEFIQNPRNGRFVYSITWNP
jgi:membrane protease YdiL (CAAX protease family)